MSAVSSRPLAGSMTRPHRAKLAANWFAANSPVEEAGFELVWGFSCQVVVFGFLPVLCSERESRSSFFNRAAGGKRIFPLEAVSSPWPVDRCAKKDPSWRWVRLVPVANRRAPRASRSALTSDGAARAGGACLPTGANRGGTQSRFLNTLRPAGVMVLSAVCPMMSEPQPGVGKAGTAMSRARSTRRRVATKNAGLPCLVPAGRASA